MIKKSNRDIVECENCKLFFDENLTEIINVKRTGSERFFNEIWCNGCINTVNKGVS